jgi:hypothetical protein
MKSPLIALFAAVLLFSGCATQTKEQLAAIRSAGVSPALVRKLERGGRLTPADIIELKRRHVNDAVALRQLDHTGVDYIVDKDIVRQLRKAGVSEDIITAAKTASERYADQFLRPYVSASYNQWWSPYPSPFPFYDPFFYGYAQPLQRCNPYRPYQYYPQHHRRGAMSFLPPGPHRLFR